MISAVNKINEPCMIKVKVQNCILKIEIDSRSVVPVNSEGDCRIFVDGIRLRITGNISV